MELSKLSEAVDNEQILGSPTVLIIDDDKFVCESLEFALQFMGCQTLSAMSGQTGLELYKDYSASIDLVLLDYYMPGMNGEQTFHKLVQLNPDLRCIFSSGLKIDLNSETLSAPLTHVDFLYKPYDLKLLKAKINDLLAN
ncbi:MAG: response regulator [Anaerolineae bacterium]